MTKINHNVSKYNKMTQPVLLTARGIDNLEQAIDQQIDKLCSVCDLNRASRGDSKLRNYSVNEFVTAERFLYRFRDIAQDAIQVVFNFDYTKDRYAIDGHKVIDLACDVEPELLGPKITGFINRM